MISTNSEPRCTCGGKICRYRKNGERDKRFNYTCRGCKRRVPWCFGAADNMPNHCDDCWVPN